MSLSYKAPAITWVSGGKGTWFPAQFLPRQGPRGGRLVVEAMHVEGALFYTTGAGVTMAGSDFASSLKKFRVYDRNGNLRYLRGSYLRLKAFEDLADAAPADPASLAASQTNQPRTFNFLINFSQPLKAEREHDTALEVDRLFTGGIEFDMPAASDLLATGGTPSIVSGTYTLTCYCREEWDVEFHTVDMVEEFPQSNNTAFVVPVNGRWVRSINIAKEAASGGVTVSTISDATVEAYNLVGQTANALRQVYLRQNAVATADPVAGLFMQPVIVAKRGHKITDCLRIGSDLLIRLTSTMATPDVIMHSYRPRDQQTTQLIAAQNGVDVGAATMKTARKGQRQPKNFGGLAAILPAKVNVG
jgi:hypothetical protein